ncbi:TBC1 domain family member 5 isoform X2 [Plodia interpunctella]|uniref:TBC1 domain family member 5 isoform X2 n=1 Tax=Plodia interpunctella TaxID=58824 RepID=UPI0023677920|nr:TBC1 domain family member 5 isoform X2 [Plodia interpunctella]
MDNNNHSDHSPSSPTKERIEIRDYYLQLPEWGLESLKNAAIQQRLPRPRSLAWAILLNAVPPPNQDIVSSVQTHRKFYNDLKLKLSMDPRAVIGDDPLSQNDESAWKQHFCDNELKALILQDVVRTFPDELYFREKDVQDIMVEVLFFWARSHSHVGYRQGMHEILAPVMFELYLDRKFAPNNLSDTLKYVLQEEYLEHDSYMLFNSVMKGLERFYTTGDVVPTSEGRMPTSNVVHNPNEVVRYLEKIKDEYLVPLDAELASHLNDCNISLELFGIRWLRLLFGREFPRSEIPHLWGFLFADGPTLPHIHFVVIAMLISIRNILVDPDAGVVLSALMRPSPLSAGHVSALALHLRRPLDHPRPPPPPPPPRHVAVPVNGDWSSEIPPDEDSGSEGVAEVCGRRGRGAGAGDAGAAARAAAARRRPPRARSPAPALRRRAAAAPHTAVGSPNPMSEPRINRRRNSPRSGRGSVYNTN